MKSFHCLNLVKIGCNAEFLSRFQVTRQICRIVKGEMLVQYAGVLAISIGSEAKLTYQPKFSLIPHGTALRNNTDYIADLLHVNRKLFRKHSRKCYRA